MKLVPLPVVQCAPPSVLYCQLATSLAKVTSTWPLLVMPSLPLLPVSASSVTPGGATVWSTNRFCETGGAGIPSASETFAVTV